LPTPPATPAPLPSPIVVPPPPLAPVYQPFPSVSPIPLDEAHNGVGIAQQICRQRGYQGRLLWIDATANMNRYNTADKIASLVSQIKSAGFNTIVFDIKPIIGFTIYPSRFAPKLTDWVKPGSTQTLPADFDPVREMVNQTRLQKINLILSMNAFSEGHRDFQKGPAYDHPEWQTILYDVQMRIRRDVIGTESYALCDRPNISPRVPDQLAVYTDVKLIRPTDATTMVALLDTNGTVLAQMTASALATVKPQLPTGGAALVALSPTAIAFLQRNALPGQRMAMDESPNYVPMGQRPELQVPLMVNPNLPAVRQRILDMVGEVATNYAADGIIFDDRLRYANINADFSPASRQQFETYIGKKLRWPDDVFHYDVDFPTLDRHLQPGPYYNAWMTFRALSLRNWLADAVRTAKTIRPEMTVNTYAGSWYPDYPGVGANWGAPDLQAGFFFLNDAYKATGWAGIVDFVTTGCYYTTATIAEAVQKGANIGDSVEAAGQFSNRAVNDQAIVYAGISLDRFDGNADGLRRALQAAAASTQGVMVFDFSHNIDQFWPVFTQAFSTPAVPPHAVPGLIDELRSKHEAQRTLNAPQPPVVIYRGTSGTGF